MGSEVQLPAFLMEVFHTNKDDPSEEAVEEEEEEQPQPRKITRTAMGEYIAEPGEKPLTSLGLSAPGPADYLPKMKFTRTEPPHYSMTANPKPKKIKITPGPASYDTTGNLKWRHKRITLKGKARSMSDEEAAKAASDIGPAKYSVKVNEVGTTGFRYSMARRSQYYGFVNSLMQTSDVNKASPGPAYRPSSAHWGHGPEKTFGNSRKTAVESKTSPGPADYDMPPVANKKPAYSLAKRLDAKGDTHNVPGPNAYDVGTTIGKAVAKSMTARREDLLATKYGPAPNSYTLQSSLANRDTAKSLTYRWFDRVDEYQPGPGDYDIKQEAVKPRNPAFSCRKRTKETGPVGTEISPGPANYPLIKEFSKNDKPAYSMGLRITTSVFDSTCGPGPNSYYVEQFQKPGTAAAPAYSIGKRIEPAYVRREGPGPAAYKPTVPLDGPRYSMSKRIKNLKGFENPGPNKYNPPSQQTKKGLPTRMGIGLKSRASPWIYSGFKTNRVMEPMSDVS